VENEVHEDFCKGKPLVLGSLTSTRTLLLSLLRANKRSPDFSFIRKPSRRLTSRCSALTTVNEEDKIKRMSSYEFINSKNAKKVIVNDHFQ
jgi:hypothetical protein